MSIPDSQDPVRALIETTLFYGDAKLFDSSSFSEAINGVLEKAPPVKYPVSGSPVILLKQNCRDKIIQLLILLARPLKPAVLRLH